MMPSLTSEARRLVTGQPGPRCRGRLRNIASEATLGSGLQRRVCRSAVAFGARGAVSNGR